MRRVISIVAVALVALVVVAAAIALLWPALGRSIWWQVYAYRWWISPCCGGGPGPARLAVHSLPAAPTGSTWRNNVLTAASALDGRIQVVRATPRRVRKIP